MAYMRRTADRLFHPVDESKPVKVKKRSGSKPQYPTAKELECCEHCPYSDCISTYGVCLKHITYEEYDKLIHELKERRKNGETALSIGEDVGLSEARVFTLLRQKSYPTMPTQKKLKAYLERIRKGEENHVDT